MCFVCSAMSQKFWDTSISHGGLTNAVGQGGDFQTGGQSGNVGAAFLTGGLSNPGTSTTGGFSTGGTAQGETGAPVSEEATATTQGSTGVQNIDALLSGQKWAGSALTFMFPDTTSYFGAGYYDQNALQGFAVATAAQQTSAKAAFAAVAGLTNMSFSEVLASSITGPYSPQVDITIARSSYPGTAYAYYPYTDQVGGDVWMGTTGGNSNPVKGNYGWHTMWHELGHALGLKHGHDSTSGVTNQALTSDRDGMEFSVMTYRSYIGSSTSGGYGNESWGYAQSFMMYDIAALQTMYGADFTTNSGNTTYTFSSTTGEMFINGVGQGAPGGNRVFLTIWDGNGVDTYDFSNYTTNQTIDLTPGSWSLMSAAQRANLGDGNYARANVYNALQFNGDLRSLIENANGGSGNDTITANVAANTIAGGLGADTIFGWDGNDTIFGGRAATDAIDGNDTIHGGAGNDVLHGNAGKDVVFGGTGADTIYGGIGDDILVGGTAYTDPLDTGDFIYGQDGHDTIHANAGDDLIEGGGGADIIYGGIGNDVIYGQTATIQSEISSNSIFGQDGNDILVGAAGNDTIHGDGGNDRIDGALGNDLLSGGSGADTFLFLKENFGRDTITDFDPAAGDRIELSTSICADFSQLMQFVTTNGAETLITFSTSEVIELRGVSLAQIQASNFHFV